MGCNCRQYICVPAPQTCCTPETETVLYTFENANAVGLGFFDNESSQLVQFRGLVSDSDALTLVLDAPNKVIRIDFDGDLLINDIPDATEAQRGMLEVATQAEANAGAVDNKIMTPLKVATMQATETQIGVLRIATDADVATGTNDTDAVTSLKLATFASSQKTTRTFADAVARAAAVPNFDGQLGIQLDTNALVMATGVVAGTFSLNIVIGGALNVTSTLTGAGAIFTSVTSNGDLSVSGNTFLAGGELDFDNMQLAFSGTPVGGVDTVLGQFGSALAGKALAEFLSTSNVQTGYTDFANPAVLRTCDTTTVTLPQLAQIVGTLINDIKALQLPAT